MFGKEFTRAKNAERDLNPTKGCINGMCFVDSTKQYIFLSSASYIIFCGCSSGGLKTEADLNIQGYVKTNYPQLGKAIASFTWLYRVGLNNVFLYFM